MAVMIKYTKSQYEAKITELEGYYNQLSDHLSTMEGYKEQIFQFWDDPRGQDTAETLNKMITQVRNAMDRTSDLLTFYKSSVEKLSGADISAKSLLTDALGILGSLGI